MLKFGPPGKKFENPCIVVNNLESWDTLIIIIIQNLAMVFVDELHVKPVSSWSNFGQNQQLVSKLCIITRG